VQVQKDAIVVAKNEYEMDVEGGALDFEILTNVDVTVSIPDSVADWISHVESRALESQTLHFDIAPCDLSENRSGTITLSGGNAVQKILIKQEQMKIDPAAIPDNEIWYRTIDNKIYDIYHCTNTYGNQPFNTSIISHTYENGLGVIKCKETITLIDWHAFGNAFGNSNLSELYLPETIEVISQEGIYNNQYLTTLRIPKNLKSIQGLNNPNLALLTGAHVSEDGRCIIIDEDLKAFAPKGIKIYKTPAGVKSIGYWAFCGNKDLEEISFEEGVEIMNWDAFGNCKSLKKVTLPLSLKILHPYAFRGCTAIEGFYGNEHFHTSDNLCLFTYANCNLSYGSDKWLINFAGSELSEYTIPEGINNIENFAFEDKKKLKNITIPSTLRQVAGRAFEGCDNLEAVYGELASEDHRYIIVGDRLERYLITKNAPKHFEVPDNIKVIGDNAFLNAPFETITMGDQVIVIGGYAFQNCQNLKSITISANVKCIGEDNGIGGFNPFHWCLNLETIYFRSPIPPLYKEPVQTNYSNLTFYVPKESLSAYQNSGWFEFAKYMKGYEYDDLPALPDIYMSTDYSQDRKVTTLQASSVGNGIDVVLMGDGYSDRQIADGTYQTDMENLYNNLFTEEPYKSFKDYFNVYYVNVVSATEGYEHSGAALGGFFGDGTLVGGNDNAVFDYALKAISEEEMDEALLIVAMNSDNYAGTCYMYQPTSGGDYGSGPSVSYFPRGGDAETFAQLLHHEACGHGFAKLADEYAYEEYGTISVDEINAIKEQQNYWGWWKNVDFTNDLSQIRWSKFINDSRYANEGLGAYEGGLTYWTGVWRPTENSIMRYNTGGFNAPSREAIYYRIHKLAYGADWQYDYEKFVEWDAVNRNSTTARSLNHVEVPKKFKPLHAPVVKRQTWKDAK